MKKVFAALFLVIGLAGLATAGLSPTVPEIDPTSAVGALVLLSGGLLLIRSRRKK